MASDQQYGAYDSGGRICEDERIGRILESVSGGYSVGRYYGGGDSVLEKDMAFWQKEKKRKILCENGHHHDVAENCGGVCAGGDRGCAV